MHQETTNEEVSNAFGKLKIALNINSSFKENNNQYFNNAMEITILDIIENCKE